MSDKVGEHYAEGFLTLCAWHMLYRRNHACSFGSDSINLPVPPKCMHLYLSTSRDWMLPHGLTKIYTR